MISQKYTFNNKKMGIFNFENKKESIRITKYSFIRL